MDPGGLHLRRQQPRSGPTALHRCRARADAGSFRSVEQKYPPHRQRRFSPAGGSSPTGGQSRASVYRRERYLLRRRGRAVPLRRGPERARNEYAGPGAHRPGSQLDRPTRAHTARAPPDARPTCAAPRAPGLARSGGRGDGDAGHAHAPPGPPPGARQLRHARRARRLRHTPGGVAFR